MLKPYRQSRIHLVRRPMPVIRDLSETLPDDSREFVQVPFDFDSLLDAEDTDNA